MHGEEQCAATGGCAFDATAGACAVDAAYATCSDWTADGPRLDAESGLAVACAAGGDSFTKDSCEVRADIRGPHGDTATISPAKNM